MTTKIKYFLTLCLLVILPLLLSFSISYMDENHYINLNTSTLNNIALTAVAMGIFGSGLVVFLNHNSRPPKSYWYSIPIALMIGLGLIFAVGHSISNFGF